MTATDELRRLLDERGVEWEQSPQDGWYRTEWTGRYGKCNAMEWKPTLTVMMPNLTPEQAIAATLGGGKLTAEQVRELIAPHLHARPTFDFGHHGAVWRADFHAIADELNATLGGGECECDGTIEWKWTVPTTYYQHELSCGHVITSMDSEPPNFCEECGAKIRKAVKR